jgi:hypothetical protein
MKTILHEFEWIELVVVLNGLSLENRKAAEKLHAIFDSRVRIFEFSQNTSVAEPVWTTLRQLDLQWVVFPGDDDEFIPDSFRVVRKDLSSSSDLFAIGYSAKAIDAAGKETGKVLQPLKVKGLDKGRLLAHLLHKPPFVWPSLLFRFDKIPSEVFLSRFVSDWWTSLQLFSAGGVASSTFPILRYRTHGHQESNLTSNSRKRFEASIMLYFFLESSNLQSWLSTDKELDAFLDTLKKYPPIYGDFQFSGSIVAKLIHILADIGREEASLEAVSLLGHLATSNGVVMPMNEFPHYSRVQIQTQNLLNISFVAGSGICQRLRELILSLKSIENALEVRVGCLHTLTEDEGLAITLNCLELDSIRDEEFSDIICRATSFILQNNRSAASELSIWEWRVVKLIRRTVFKLRKLKSPKQLFQFIST